MRPKVERKREGAGIRLRRSVSSRRKRLDVRRRGMRRRPGASLRGAKARLRYFRQASLLALAITGLLLLLISPGESEPIVGAEEAPLAQNGEEAPAVAPSVEKPAVESTEDIGKAAAEEASRTMEGLREGVYSTLPKLLVSLGIVLVAWLLLILLRPVLRRSLVRWESAHALTALFGIGIWLLSAGIILSVLVGDIRALAGSLGLVGLALSWALQTPIESFTGWLLNSFQGYYRVGDRVAVGEVFGDVYKIDFLTTTVWEIGSPGSAGFVQAEQPTGRLITFPNSEVLAGTVVNLTRDFPFVWDELAVPLANESDLPLAMTVLGHTARELLGAQMQEPARRYAEILRKAGLEPAMAEEPQVFLAMNESWTDVVVRYLVHARQRRTWKSELTVRVMAELGKEEYVGSLLPVYPRRQLQFIDPQGRAQSDVWGRLAKGARAED